MALTRSNDKDLVVAAQAGERRALDDLMEAYLPFVYTIVRRALADDPDVDDVVQECMLRAMRELPKLRTPESFRAWLGAIAIRQTSSHLRRRRSTERRTGHLAESPDVHAPFEGLTMLRLGIAEQRRQAARAAHWLDDDDRMLLSLWWLEVAGYLTRSELAAAAGLDVAHAGVRIQRMRQQFDHCRALVATLDARPRCTGIDDLVAGWDGSPGSLWRKRIVRHIQACDACRPVVGGLLAADRLLVGLALLPVPIALTSALIGNVPLATTPSSVTILAGAAKSAVSTFLAKSAAAPPIVALAVVGCLVVGATLAATTTFSLTTPASRRPAIAPRTSVATPTPAPLLAYGPSSLEVGTATGLFVTTTATLGVVAPLSNSSSAAARQQATFDVVPGLADPKCFSFRSRDGRYLRHASWRLRLNTNEGTRLFEADATFCVRSGSTATTLYLESSNYPGWLLRRRGSELWVDRSDGTATFQADSIFRIRPPLAG